MCVLNDSENEAGFIDKQHRLAKISGMVQFSTCSAIMPAKRNRQSVIVIWDQKVEIRPPPFTSASPSPSSVPARHQRIVQTSMSGRQCRAHGSTNSRSMPIGGGRVQRLATRHLSLPKTQRQTHSGLPVRSRRTKRISDLIPAFRHARQGPGVFWETRLEAPPLSMTPPISPAIVMLSRPLAPLLMMNLAADVNQDQLNHLLVSLPVIEYSLHDSELTINHLPTPDVVPSHCPSTDPPVSLPTAANQLPRHLSLSLPYAWETINFFYFPPIRSAPHSPLHHHLSPIARVARIPLPEATSSRPYCSRGRSCPRAAPRHHLPPPRTTRLRVVTSRGNASGYQAAQDRYCRVALRW